jgi:hypothetical protein
MVATLPIDGRPPHKILLPHHDALLSPTWPMTGLRGSCCQLADAGLRYARISEPDFLACRYGLDEPKADPA